MMAKGKVEEKKGKEKVSMKEALSGIVVKEAVKSDVNRVSFRDFLWNYPTYLRKTFKQFVPLSYLVSFLLAGVLVSIFLESNVIARVLDDSGKRDTFVEGSVGAITTFNPLFVSVNYVDKAVQELVFDRFVYVNSDGSASAGVAKEWSVSEDRLTYEFKIKEDLYWQDGSSLSAEDVLFTFQTAKDLAEEFGFDSVGVSLDGVGVAINEKGNIVFQLSEPNPTFFEAISIMIVPKSRLENEDLNQLAFNMFARYPLGSGRYKVVRTEQTSVYLEDNPYDSYEPDIQEIVFRVFPDKESMEMSFRIGALDAVGGWDYDLLRFTEEYPNVTEFIKSEEYRTKMIFFNIRRDILEGKEIRIALNYLINKNALVENSDINANVRKGPFSEKSWAFSDKVDYYAYNPEKAVELLKGSGYVKNEETGYFENKEGEILSLTLSYFDSITNERLVNVLKEQLKEEGVFLKLEKLSFNQITQEIIATRDFDLLLYEIETTVDPDQYNLWHSLKTNYPDLNMAGYSYERVDILLEDARKTSDRKIRKEKYDLFQRYLMADSPVVFLYNPNFFYYVKDSISGVDLNDINYSYQRFHNIEDWVLE